eukprot:2950611-Prymnesium_polylepis.1
MLCAALLFAAQGVPTPHTSVSLIAHEEVAVVKAAGPKPAVNTDQKLHVLSAHEMSHNPKKYANLLAASTASPLLIGPILVVYCTCTKDSDGTTSTPESTLDQVKTMVFGKPGMLDAYNQSSWGETGVRLHRINTHRVHAHVRSL